MNVMYFFYFMKSWINLCKDSFKLVIDYQFLIKSYDVNTRYFFPLGYLNDLSKDLILN